MKNSYKFFLNFLFLLLTTCTFNDQTKIIWLTQTIVNEELDFASGIENRAGDFILENLVSFAANSSQIKPQLAEKWEINYDKNEVLFTLKQNVRFHDGAIMTSKDVVDSFKRQFDNEHPFYPYGIWNAYKNHYMDYIIKDVIAVDEYNVKFILNAFEYAFFTNLAMPFASIISSTSQEQNGSIAGTGKYRFESYKDNTLTLKYFDHYHGTLDKKKSKIIDTIYLISDKNIGNIIDSKTKKLNKTNIMVIEDNKFMNLINPNNESFFNQSFKTFEQIYLALNTNNPPFNDIQQRKKLLHLINNNKTAFPELKTSYTISDNLIPDVFNHYISPDQNQVDEVFDFDISPFTITAPLEYKIEAEAIVKLLKKLDISVTLELLNWNEFFDSVENSKHQSALSYWKTETADIYNIFNQLLTNNSMNFPSTNYAYWSNDDFENLINEANTTASNEKRVKLYTKAYLTIKKEAPWIISLQKIQDISCHEKIKGVSILPNNRVDITNLSIK